MKIGFFVDSYFPRKDGLVYSAKTWKKKLEERGHEVYVFYPGSSYEPDQREIPLNSVKNPLYKHYIGLPARSSSIPDLDLVHCHSPGFIGLTGRNYARKHDIPSVYTFHTPLEDYIPQVVRFNLISKVVKFAYKKFDDWFISTFDVVTSNTDELPRNTSFITLPVGIDMDFFQETDRSFIDEMELKKPVLGYSGRLGAEKKIDNIIEFFDQIDGTLIIVGEGREKEKLKKIASDNVIFKDFLDREKLKEFYSGIDVFVTASESDTLSLTTLEASACGTPVLAPDVHPFNKTITDNGELYQPGDNESFKDKLSEIISQTYSTRKEVEKYSVEKTIDQLLDIYQEVSKNKE